MTYREVVRRLRAAGFVLDRQARGSHEIWRNPQTQRRTTVPNHPGDLPTGTVGAIFRAAGIDVTPGPTPAPAPPSTSEDGT